MGKDTADAEVMYPVEKLTPEEAWEIGIGLLADHSAKHTMQRDVKETVRQRIVPQQVMPDKYLITSRGAVGWAIVRQMLSYFEPTLQKIKVPPRKKVRAEDVRTSNLEGWLIASSETVNRRNDFVEGAAIYNGIEVGEMILGAAFDPFLAKRGEFPIEVMAPDPEVCAYARSHYGLTYFVSQEIRTANALRHELGALKKRGKSIFITEELAKSKPTDVLEDTRFYTNTHEYRWIAGESIYQRRHFAGRVPFDIGMFNGMPSDRPEEWAKGTVSPVLDLLKSYQQLIDLFVTDAEIGQRPLGILFDGQGHFEIVQLAPGENYDGTTLVPVPYNANQALLHEIATMINDQLDIAALPRTTFSGPQISLSGYALDRFREGLMARLTYLKKNPENALGSHMDLRLRLVKHFATMEMAKVFSPDDTERYLNSFSALGDKVGQKGEKKETVWWNIRAAEIGQNDTVLVELSPNLPADEAGKMQRYQTAIQGGIPREWALRYILEVENADEVLRQMEMEMVLAGVPMFKEFYLDFLMDKIAANDKDIGKALTKWMSKQNLSPSDTPQPDMSPQVQGAIPPELKFTPGAQPAQISAQTGAPTANQGQAGQGATPSSPLDMTSQQTAQGLPEHVSLTIAWKDLSPEEKAQFGEKLGITEPSSSGASEPAVGSTDTGAATDQGAPAQPPTDSAQQQPPSPQMALGAGSPSGPPSPDMAMGAPQDQNSLSPQGTQPVTIDPQQLKQVLAMLPPELQQAFQQMIQSGMSPEDALRQIVMMLQGAQGQQGASQASASPLGAPGQLPPNAAMAGAMMGG